MTSPAMSADNFMRENSARSRPGQARGSRPGLPVVVATVLALVTACSSSSHPAVSRASSSPNLVAMNTYARCLRAHGLPEVRVTSAPAGPSLSIVMIFDGLAIEGATRGAPQTRTAVRACHHLLPQGTR
jgi:hypothetical protein